MFLEAYSLASDSLSSPLNKNLKAADVTFVVDSTKKFLISSWMLFGSLLVLRSSYMLSEAGN